MIQKLQLKPSVIVRMALLSICLTGIILAQVAPPEGPRKNTPGVHALQNAKVIISPGRVLAKGTVVIRDGAIEAVGENLALPPDATIWNLEGMTIYPGLIDMYSDYGMPKQPAQPSPGRQAAEARPSEPSRGAEHWNETVRPRQDAAELFSPDQKTAENLRAIGFTSALVVPTKGLFRGTSALVNLGDGKANDQIVKRKVAHHISLAERGAEGKYPTSLMGAIALIRQTLYDVRWYHEAQDSYAKHSQGQKRPEVDQELAALQEAAFGKVPIVIEMSNELDILRASKIAKEFGLPLLIRGSGYEYRRLNAVKGASTPIILPVNFPDPPQVETPQDALNVTLQELQHWDTAPENPARLSAAQVSFALTATTLKDVASFRARVHKAIERGLPADSALAALTTRPAKFLGLEKHLGTVEAGKLANLVVTDGDLFAERTKIRETWIDGKRYEVKPKPEIDPRGKWSAELSIARGTTDSASIDLKGEVESLQGSIKIRKKQTKLTNASFGSGRLALAFSGDSVGYAGIVRMTGVSSPSEVLGSGELGDGKSFGWKARRIEPFKPGPDTTKSKPSEPTAAAFPVVSPPGEFGRANLPAQPDDLLIRDATLWTSSAQGKMESADLLIRKGKITKLGKNLETPAGALIIDAKGKHVTPGLIDCHSHTAISDGVNEVGQAITAEVRIGDVIDPDAIFVYQQLAGGLTAANLLHGSANPIGGQNAVIKLRWGALPEELKFEGAPPGIKFALGENPKQSNWGDRFTTRYPQTRMGVEEIIRDEFRAAQDYQRAWEKYQREKGKGVIPPRRDLELDAIVEILNGKRLVHSHSYRQDEILMLMRVAEEFGFRVATFQHVLEGYKVGDIMAKHGAGASTFSDWWAYKFEVYDAIPYNGTLMHDAGVVVSFNSDSPELARRLNTEAAKAVKYGGLSEEEALKLVTLNPAKQLRVDDRVGSLEVGKDADFVIWSGSPLSTYSVCEQTWIDGRKYFDREEDARMREEIAKQRSVLIQRALKAKKPTEKPPAQLGEQPAPTGDTNVSEEVQP